MRQLPERADVEHYRNEAKSLQRAYASGVDDATRRVRAALGDANRFVLADAQYVVALEHGLASWAALRDAINRPRDEPRLAAVRAQFNAERAGWGETASAMLDSGLVFADGEPLLIEVRKRQHRYDLGDAARSIGKAGRPPGWRQLAIEAAAPMNLRRNGIVFVSAVEGRDIALLALRLSDSAMAVYDALLAADG